MTWRCLAGVTPTDKKDALTQQPNKITLAFYNRAPKPHMKRQKSHVDHIGLLRWVFYIAAFGLYLFTRRSTISANGSKDLFAYQLAVLLAECFIFMSGALIGLWQVRKTLLQVI